ncbi:cobalamin biosynthesis protein [Streptomyces beihaiensis]|uniref:Cobalamin biosynthesis protein n=1 Tax=Streptomyces beihaiensis TaxID=2984495 RepID=A0ABT3U484_9ACTN|nr:cobalamin biosynthesis protein [Streptomyces beihaiensis]MCX3064145.1 cobalamin biosynthesis protein [Streptomyces beihaiensis]
MLSHAASAPHTGGGPGDVVVGVGARAGVSTDEVLALVAAVLRQAAAGAGRDLVVVALATVDSKGREPGIVGAAGALGTSLVTFPAERLADVVVPHPSRSAQRAAGTPSVAEAAALAYGQGPLLVPKRTSAGPDGGPGRVTCAVARAG